MSKLNIYRSPLLKTGFTALAVIMFSQTVAAKDQFEVKIKPVTGVAADINYEAMEKQAAKFCKREAGKTDHRLTPIRYKYAYINKCVFEVMDKVMQQIQDPDLMALHNLKTSELILLTQRDTTTKN